MGYSWFGLSETEVQTADDGAWFGVTAGTCLGAVTLIAGAGKEIGCRAVDAQVGHLGFGNQFLWERVADREVAQAEIRRILIGERREIGDVAITRTGRGVARVLDCPIVHLDTIADAFEVSALVGGVEVVVLAHGTIDAVEIEGDVHSVELEGSAEGGRPFGVSIDDDTVVGCDLSVAIDITHTDVARLGLVGATIVGNIVIELPYTIEDIIVVSIDVMPDEPVVGLVVEELSVGTGSTIERENLILIVRPNKVDRPSEILYLDGYEIGSDLHTLVHHRAHIDQLCVVAGCLVDTLLDEEVGSLGVVVLDGTHDTIAKEAEVEPDIVTRSGFPLEVGVLQLGGGQVSDHCVLVAELHIVAIDQTLSLVGVDSLIADRTGGEAEFEIGEPVDIYKPVLLVDTPSERACGEDAPLAVFAKDAGAIDACADREKVFIHEAIVDTPHETHQVARGDSAHGRVGDRGGRDIVVAEVVGSKAGAGSLGLGGTDRLDGLNKGNIEVVSVLPGMVVAKDILQEIIDIACIGDSRLSADGTAFLVFGVLVGALLLIAVVDGGIEAIGKSAPDVPMEVGTEHESVGFLVGGVVGIVPERTPLAIRQEGEHIAIGIVGTEERGLGKHLSEIGVL